MSRPTRIAGSFAIVTVAYWIYALVAVPLIEPPADPRRSEPGADTERMSINRLLDLQVKQLAGLFEPGSWELNNPMIFNLDESDSVKLLLKDYENLADGRVKITPCTIVFGRKGPGDEDERRRQSIVLRAPQGAVLRFDPPFDFKHPNPSTEFVDGQLHGEITISSQGKSPGSEDDLRIVGSDLFLTKQAITTPNNIDFRLGPHHGRGSDMVVKLLSDPTTTKGKAPTPSGIESFDLQHVDELSLDMSASMPGKPSAAAPVLIHCQGPLHFDANERVATFSDHVEVMKSNPTGPRDQILCDVLAICFSPGSKPAPGAAAAKKGKDAGLSDLVVERIEAHGNPVVVSAPSELVNANGQHLTYNLLTGAMTLNGNQGVMLQRGPNEIHAPSLFYQSDPHQSGPTQRLGRVAAAGPGWLRGHPSQTPGQPETNQQFDLIWKGQLTVEPDKQYQRIAVDGGAEATFRNLGETGQLSAQEIFVWLSETPSKTNPKASDPHPHHMLARKNVVMTSPQLTGRVEHLEAWFVDRPAGNAGAGRMTRVVPGMPLAQPPNLAQQPNHQPMPWQSLAVLQTGQSPTAASPGDVPQPNASQAGPAQQRFEVVGRLLQINILLQDQQPPAVSELMIEDGVQFTEIQTAQPNERPLAVLGSKLVMTKVENPEATIVTLTGQPTQPAQFEARGLRLTGPSINLNRGTNRLWIDGSGQMDLPLPAEMQGKTPAGSASGVLPITWQRGMSFDGRMARFEQSVVIQTPQQRLCTETMDVYMQQPVSFAESKMQQSPQVEKIRCLGGVWMENREFDEQQQLVANDHFQVSDLVYYVSTDVMEGGAGYLTSVRLGGDGLAGNPAGAPPNAPPTQMHGLHVRFQQSLSGNLKLHRNITFRGRVSASFAPVNSWDTVLEIGNPDALGPKGMVLQCDELTVREMPTPLKNRQSVELEAAGNVRAEDPTFTATGDRITYDQSKDLLMLKGDGRNDAHLYHQEHAGEPRSDVPAQQIIFSRKTNQVRVVNPSMIDFNQFPIRQMPRGNGKK